MTLGINIYFYTNCYVSSFVSGSQDYGQSVWSIRGQDDQIVELIKCSTNIWSI